MSLKRMLSEVCPIGVKFFPDPLTAAATLSPSNSSSLMQDLSPRGSSSSEQQLSLVEVNFLFPKYTLVSDTLVFGKVYFTKSVPRDSNNQKEAAGTQLRIRMVTLADDENTSDWIARWCTSPVALTALILQMKAAVQNNT
jgi:hypothetical protein